MPTNGHLLRCPLPLAGERQLETLSFVSRKPQSRSHFRKSLIQRLACPRLHLLQPFSNRVSIVLSTQGVLGLTMSFAINQDVHSLCHRIDNFKFAVASREEYCHRLLV